MRMDKKATQTPKKCLVNKESLQTESREVLLNWAFWENVRNTRFLIQSSYRSEEIDSYFAKMSEACCLEK